VSECIIKHNYIKFFHGKFLTLFMLGLSFCAPIFIISSDIAAVSTANHEPIE
jgi:hypothetical protein